LGFRHAKLDGFDYLVAEVFGLGSHFHMIAPRSMFMASAVELRQGEVRRIPLPRTRVNKIKKKGQNSREIAAAQLRPTGRSTCGTLPPHTIGALSEA
jgi:hypothetical protein